MPPRGRVNWKGDSVRDKVLTATRKGIDATMGDAVATAQPNTPWVTGNLRRSIRIVELAKVKGNEIVGVWGSASPNVDYARYVEAGAQGRSGRYMLRNAADVEYPKLNANIKSYLA